MNFREFSIEDFVWNEDFRRWIQTPNAESDLFWSEWLSSNPDKTHEINAARQILKAIEIEDNHLSADDVEIAIANILDKIEDDNIQRLPEIKTRKLRLPEYSISIAASIIFIFSILSFLYFRNEAGLSANLVEKVNNGPGLLQLHMYDGSKIILEKGAKVSFPKTFTGLKSRKIYLTGEAFFDVAKDPLKPFIVYSNGLITKVLGTKFRIRSYAKEKISIVEVTSGVVAVYSLTDKDSEDEKNGEKLNSIILTRNQKANYSNEDRTVMASIVEQPVAIDNKIFNYTFFDTPIKQIFENIEEGYGIDIIYDEKVLGKRTFTADLSKVSMYDKLKIISKVLNTRYEIIDGKIIISPN